MTNTLGNYVATIYANQVLNFLTQRLGLANRVHRGFDLSRTVDRGDTIKIRRPQIVPATAMPASATALVPDNVTINMNRWFGNTIEVTDKEYSQAAEGLIPEHLPSLAYGVAKAIDSDLVSLITTVPHVYTAAAATVAVADVLGVQRKLIDLACDTEDTANMFGMVGAQENADLLALGNFSGWNAGGPAQQTTLMSGAIGQRYGFNFHVNQQRGTVAYADVTDFAGTITEPAAKGATSITVGGLGTSEVYNKGTLIKFDVSGHEYAITADATMSSGAAVVAINPPIRVAELDNAAITVGKTQGESTPNQDNVTRNANVFYHREWAALAMGRLPDYAAFADMKAAQIASVQEPVTGLSVRTRIGYDFANAKVLVGCDALWGFAELNGDMACRLEIAGT